MGHVRVEGIGVRFDAVEALRDVDFAAQRGERVAIIGASGAGKSTLFSVLSRSVEPYEGQVFVGERDLYALDRRELRDARRRIGTIHQAYNLVPQLTAGVNAALGEVGAMGGIGTLKTFLAGPDATLSERTRRALAEVGLAEKAGARAADLSGGQQQRVAVARLLVQRPELVLADEPFAAVDQVTTELVLEALLGLNRAGATLLVNLHDVGIARRFPRVVALREGRVVFDGQPERLTDERLAEIYAGDRRGAVGDEYHDGGHSGWEPVRVAEGRDGVASH